MTFLTALGLSLQLAIVDSARLIDDRVVVEPLAFSIQVPPLWLGRPDPANRGLCDARPAGTVADRIRTDRASFGDLQRARGEWTREYSAVVDSVLPFGSLVAQLGGDPWNGTCGAPQLRIYVRDTAAVPVAVAAVHGVRAAERFFTPVSRIDADSSGWAMTRLAWNAWYHDYGGTATVEFWSRRIRARTVTLVFMYTPHNEYWRTLKSEILRSAFF